MHPNEKTVFLLNQCGNRFLPSQKDKRTTENSTCNTLWERTFPGDTRWLREGTEPLTPVEYP